MVVFNPGVGQGGVVGGVVLNEEEVTEFRSILFILFEMCLAI